jgi:hypothetical protein
MTAALQLSVVASRPISAVTASRGDKAPSSSATTASVMGMLTPRCAARCATVRAQYTPSATWPSDATACASVWPQVAGGCQHQVAQARQAGEGFGACAQRHAEARHFGETPGNERRACVEPQLQSVTETCRNRQHVLDRTAHFDANHIVAGVDAQGRAVESGDQGVAHGRMFAGGDQRRRLTARDFQREARAAEHTRS